MEKKARREREILMRHQYQASYGSVCLRPLAEQDVEALRILRNKNKQFFYSDTEITQEQQEQWFKRYLAKKNDIMFAVHAQIENTDMFAGATALYNMSDTRCEFGRFVIDDSFRGRGLGRDALVATMGIAFGQLKMKSMHLSVLECNCRALDLYERLGFTVIGKEDIDGKRALVLNAVASEFLSRRV